MNKYSLMRSECKHRDSNMVTNCRNRFERYNSVLYNLLRKHIKIPFPADWYKRLYYTDCPLNIKSILESILSLLDVNVY